MNVDWQNTAVILMVAAAGLYLASMAWRSMARRKAGACGGCDNCPAKPEPAEPAVLSLGLPSRDEWSEKRV